MNITKQNNNGDTALMLACASGSYGIVNQLLTRNHTQIINTRNKERKTALSIAVCHKKPNHRIVQLLVDHPGIDINIPTEEYAEFSVLDEAASRGDEKMIRVLLTHPQMRVSRQTLERCIDRPNIISLISTKAMLRDILHTQLRYRDLRNDQDYRLIQLTRTKDYSENKQYISPEYKKAHRKVLDS